MARRKQASEQDVETFVAEATVACQKSQLLRLAKFVADSKTHALHRRLNRYPSLPFQIDANDMQSIAELMKFPKPVPATHTWTPWEKIFYALLWKDAKLQSIKRIIKGAEDALAKNTSTPRSAVVYHYFGRHLTDRLEEPIVDQHSVRAYRLIRNEAREKVQAIRESKLPSPDDAKAYREWFGALLKEESIKDHEDIRKLDSYLFALGAYSKL